MLRRPLQMCGSFLLDLVSWDHPSGPFPISLCPVIHTHTCPPLQVALLVACRARGIPVLASAGAGAKADPTRLRIVDVAESVADPLARAVRHRCGVKVVEEWGN